MKTPQFTIAAVLSFTGQLAFAAEIEIVCPTELPAHTLKITAPQQGWKPFTSLPVYLHSAAPIAGPPERLGRMVGRTISRTRKESTVRYDNLDAPYPEGVWFSCDYGEANGFSIAKKLPAGIKSCLVKYKNGEKAGQMAVDVKCN